VDNAVNQARKEIAQRYDFKGSTASIDFNKAESTLTLAAEDQMKINALWDVLQTRMVRPERADQKPEARRYGDGQRVERAPVITLQQGIPGDAARDIIKFLKDQKIKKVQPSIQGDQLRISSASKDELQDVIRCSAGTTSASTSSSAITGKTSAVPPRNHLTRRRSYAHQRTPCRKCRTCADRELDHGVQYHLPEWIALPHS
jgi:uncharacterized protein YajQ (UPF0234 family)